MFFCAAEIIKGLEEVEKKVTAFILILELTESGSLIDTCSEKRTLGGLVRRRAFVAALMKADFGD